MIRKMAGFRMNLRAVAGSISWEALKFLKDWWIGHITKMDQQYVPFL